MRACPRNAHNKYNKKLYTREKCFYYIKFAEKNNLPLLDKLNKCGLATEYLSELFPYLVFDENGRKKDTYNGLRVL